MEEEERTGGVIGKSEGCRGEEAELHQHHRQLPLENSVGELANMT